MSGKTILVVEDDESTRNVMAEILEGEGYTVVTAVDGEDGLKKLRAGLSPCAILLDMMMPVLNGWQFLDEQRADPTLAKIPVVVCSSYAESARSVAPSAFVQKPVTLKGLVNAIRAVCP